ncbi:M42 family metallopeptidase [Portibacter marinus]|uniref:M42 family metallopeptidase n=1 Tax=Portibacter marinus TaxID=2898660 RepID=UPI001F438B2F|nr:M42 family metallopeptidase [Portibacter marinus]
MSSITGKAKKFLFEYLSNASPTGFESPGQKIWLEYLKPFVDEVHLDNYGTSYGIINPGKKYKVVIEAHADEISWFVNYISDNGFISVIRNGGSDHVIAPSKRVNIHTKDGIVQGVFGWPAIHTRKAKDTNNNPSLSNIFIDVGAKNKDEVLEMGIHVGCVITYPDDLFQMKDFYVGRALDNKMGGFCIAEVARMLKEKKKKLPFSLYVVNAVQEEIGLRGAQMIANTIQPDVAIITDVCHDTNTPMIKTKEQGDIKAGKGPALTYAPAVHNKLLQQVIDIAEKKKIPFQRQASSRSTGTDTDAFAYSNKGVPSVLISLPLRYMHTTVEMAHKDDISNVSKLIYETLLTIKDGQSYKYF